MQLTRYIVPNNIINITSLLVGTNQPLIINTLGQDGVNIEHGFMITNMLSLLCLLIGLFSRKYIGLECLFVLQLIYYSQLLVGDADKWPAGFEYLKYLKYASGYNQIYQVSDYHPLTSLERKMYYL